MTINLAELALTMPAWIWNVLVIIFSIILGFLIHTILVPIVRHQAKNGTSYSAIRSIIRHLNKILAVFIPLLVFNSLLPFTRFNAQTHIAVEKVTEILITLSFAIVVMRFIRIFEDYLYHRFDINKENNLRERKIRTQIVFIRKLLITLIVIVTVAIVLLSFENMRKIGAGLLTGVGVGRIIIGFAAQKS
ncbi:hypothetical protein M8994_20600, partial [Brucella sp. 21LCYQ03]|nr:hypothetical protein [Brucella sp. 21LCYQ03]